MMDYPSTRLLTLLDLLRTHELVNGRSLAKQLNVNTRTVRRYINLLQEMGLPIEIKQGRYGGYRLAHDYKLPPMIFSNEEVLALSLGVVLAQQLGITSVVTAAEGAFAKMEQVMPRGLRQQVEMIQSTLTIAPQRTPMTLPSEPFLLFSQAVHEQRCVWLNYESWQKTTTERKVAPYGLVHIIGMWYVAGFCHLRQGLRTFRLDRVRNAKLMLQTFEPPNDFDPLHFVEQSIAQTPGAWNAELFLHTTLAEARALLPLTTAVLTQAEGGVWMRCAAHDIDLLAYRLLELPCPFDIHAPSELQEAFERLAMHAQTLANRARMNMD